MALDPRLIGVPPSNSAVSGGEPLAQMALQRASDLDRRVSGLEAARTSIGAGAVGSTQIANGAITVAQLQAGTILVSILTAGVVNASHIDATSIRTAVLVANSITATMISSISLTTIQAAVSSLSAITSNMGSILSGTITGATVQTGTTGARVVMNSTGLRGYASDGVTKTFEIDNGSGVATFTGVVNANGSSVIPGGTISGDNTIPGTRLVTASVDTLQLKAGSVTANTLSVGAVTAQALTISPGEVIGVINGNFTAGNPANGSTLANGWTVNSGTWTVETDTTFGKIAQGVGASTGNWYAYQDVTVPVGNHVFRCWIDSTGAAGVGAQLNVDMGTAVGTAIDSGYPALGTGWRAVEANVVITAPGTVRVYLQLGGGAGSSGTVKFANVHIVSQVTNTVLAPDSITTDKIFTGTIQAGDIGTGQITAALISGINLSVIQAAVTTLSAITANMGTITAGTITGATIQTSSGNPAVRMDSTGLFVTPDGTVKDASISTSGLTLLVGTLGVGTLPTAARRVSWQNASSAVGAEIWATQDSSASPTISYLVSDAVFGNAMARLLQRASASAQSIETSLVNSSGGQIDGTAKVLINQAGGSDYSLPETWTLLPFNTNWADFSTASGNHQRAGYRRVQDGQGKVVELVGFVKTTSAYTFGAGTATIGTLPTGYRPAEIHSFLCWQNDSAGNKTGIRVTVDSSGAIALQEGLSGIANNGTVNYLSLAGIRFPIDANLQ